MEIEVIQERVRREEYEISFHIVCGYTPAKWIRIITVYIPKPPKWIDERTRATGGEKDA